MLKRRSSTGPAQCMPSQSCACAVYPQVRALSSCISTQMPHPHPRHLWFTPFCELGAMMLQAYHDTRSSLSHRHFALVHYSEVPSSDLFPAPVTAHFLLSRPCCPFLHRGSSHLPQSLCTGENFTLETLGMLSGSLPPTSPQAKLNCLRGKPPSHLAPCSKRDQLL